MKFAPLLLVRALFMLLIVAGSAVRAEDAAPAKSGYTVTLDLAVNEKGEVGDITLVSIDANSSRDYLVSLAGGMARNVKMPVREKDGKPVSYTARAPFFFPIEDDEGPAADALPLPRAKQDTAIIPAYPAALREAGVTGGAILELVVDAEGKLTSVSTLRASHPEFATAATEAIRQWTFTPAQKDGQPVASRSRVAIGFETEEKAAEVKWRVPPRPSLGSFIVIRPDNPIDERLFGAPGAEAETPAATDAPTAPAEPAEPAK